MAIKGLRDMSSALLVLSLMLTFGLLLSGCNTGGGTGEKTPPSSQLPPEAMQRMQNRGQPPGGAPMGGPPMGGGQAYPGQGRGAPPPGGQAPPPGPR